VHPNKADLLVEGNIIAKIEAEISAPAHAQIIGCKDSIN
jgi:dihydroorotase-like cyclic amidohydrolase